MENIDKKLDGLGITTEEPTESSKLSRGKNYKIINKKESNNSKKISNISSKIKIINKLN